MGDDLYIAREFSNTALADLSAIQAMESRQSGLTIEQMSLKLAKLQSGAKRLRARAIYQSAQIVIEALNPRLISEDNFNTRLSALSQLVAQYAEGLTEIETATELVEKQPLELPETLAKTARSSNAEPRLSFADKHNAAKAILTDLMPLARGAEIMALQDIMDYDPNAAPKCQIPTKSIIQIPLEYVLRDAIQDALSIARISGKTISVSYDVGQGQIGEADIASLEKRLCEGLRALILQSLPQDGVGHIDINLRGENMVIFSKYKQPRLLPQGLIARKTANGCEVSLPLILKEPPQIPLDVHGQDVLSQPDHLEAKAMITPDTEQQLRAQLNSLMDNQTVDKDLHMDDNIIVMTDKAAKKTHHLGTDTNEIGMGI